MGVWIQEKVSVCVDTGEWVGGWVGTGECVCGGGIICLPCTYTYILLSPHCTSIHPSIHLYLMTHLRSVFNSLLVELL